MAGIEWCSVALTRGDDQDDSARADPLLADVLWRLYPLCQQSCPLGLTHPPGA